MASWLQRIVAVQWFVVTELRELLDDDALRATMLNDLGLDGVHPPPTNIDTTDIDTVETYLQADDPDTLAFIAATDAFSRTMDALAVYIDAIGQGSGSTLDARDALYVWMNFAAVGRLRRESPFLFAVARLSGVMFYEPETQELWTFGKDLLSFKGIETEEDAAHGAEQLFLGQYVISYLLRAFWALFQGGGGSGFKKLLPDSPDRVLAGWDPPPGGLAPADALSMQALTWAFELDSDDGGEQAALTTTWILIPEDHGGPTLFLSLGGHVAFEHPPPGVSDPDHRISVRLEFPQAASFFLGGQFDGENGVDTSAAAEVEYLRGNATSGTPALAFPEPTGTRLEIGTFGARARLRREEAVVELIFDESALVVSSDDADSFLASIFPAGGLRVDFGLHVGYDFIDRGLFFGGSTKLETLIPIGRTLGRLTVFHVTIKVGVPGGGSGKFAVSVLAAFSLRLGWITGIVDSIGYRTSIGRSEQGGSLGLADPPDFGFVYPRGIGLVVEAGPVNGAGFLLLDQPEQRYAGALDVDFNGWTLTLLGLIETGLEETPRFSLLLIGSVEGLSISLPAGGKVTGLGVIVGMHRTMCVAALQEAVKNHTLDAILFPDDPVRNAPHLIQSLETVFPTAPDQWILGLSIQASWLSKRMVVIEIAVLVEFPSPTRLALLGQVVIGIPTRTAPVTEIKFDVVGILDFSGRYLSVDSALYDSHIGGFPLTGELAVRARWDGEQGFALAAGGVHPRFPLPDAFPSLDRLAVTIGKGNNPRIRGLAYFAVTSNTLQFGLRAEIYAAAGGFSIEGDFSIDVLFERDPWPDRFFGSLEFGAAVKFKGRTLVGLRVTGSFEGCSPWEGSLKVRIKIAFFSWTKRVNERWGEQHQPLVEPVDAFGPLMQALGDPDSWRGRLPTGATALVTLRGQQPGAVVSVHPLGALEVVQRVLPLNVELDSMAGAPIAGDRRFVIERVSIDGLPVDDLQPLREQFAPGQHFDIGRGDEAVTRPSFERFEAGVRLTTRAVSSGVGVPTPLEYEEIVVNERMARPDYRGLYRIPVEAVLAGAERGSVAMAMRGSRNRYRGVRHGITVNEPGFLASSITSAETVPLNGLDVGTAASYTEVQQAIDRHVALHPEDIGRAQVVRQHEQVPA